MNKRWFVKIICLGTVLVFSRSINAWATSREEFLKQVNTGIINSLPPDLSLSIAFCPLKGDPESYVTNLLITQLKAKGYEPIEREHLDKIIKGIEEQATVPVGTFIDWVLEPISTQRKEQDFDISDLVDPEIAREIGELAGAKVIMFGEVRRFVHFPGHTRLNMWLRAVSGETGAILWSQDNIKRQVVSPGLKVGALFVIIIILLKIIPVLGRSRKIKESEEKSGGEEELRSQLIVELDKSLQNINLTRNELYGRNETVLAKQAEELFLAISQLKMAVKNTEFGITPKTSSRDIYKAKGKEKNIFESLPVVTRITAGIKTDTEQKDISHLASDLSRATDLIQELQTRFAARKRYV